MNLDFTKDPEWIKQREELWKFTVRRSDLKSGISAADFKALHNYFMTGVLKGDNPTHILTRMKFFPQMSVDAVAHVLNYNMPEGVKDEDISMFTGYLSGGLDSTPGLETDAAVTLFNHLFGDRYQPNFTIEFLHNDIKMHRSVPIDPNRQFASGVGIEKWLRDGNAKRSVWVGLVDYWFSLLPYVDPVLFVLGDSTYVEHVHRISTEAKLGSLLVHCASASNPKTGKPHPEEKQQFITDFHERMEALDKPEGLADLWERAKKRDPALIQW
ncbi:hypothetical protein [Allohahella sp. A8]|uniref:hypothetical protein n=1 Tax=Allohahella sp. A8 TaxID=3141461 RepID=UPI003A809912